MEFKLSSDYLLQSFNEEEAFSFGGLWQCNFKINTLTLPGKYLLLDKPTCSKDGSAFVLVEIDIDGKWRKDIKFYILIIELSAKKILRSVEAFNALTIMKIEDGYIFFSEKFNTIQTEPNQKLAIDNDNFIILMSM